MAAVCQPSRLLRAKSKRQDESAPFHAKPLLFVQSGYFTPAARLRGWEVDDPEAVVMRRGRVAVVIASFAPDLADLIRALAALAWPALILGFLLLFREEISEGINRFRKGKSPAGIEVELDALKVKTEAAEQSPEAMRGWFADLDQYFEPGRIDCSDIRDLDDRVLALGTVHAIGRESGVETVLPYTVVATFRNGLLTHFIDYADRDKALEAAGLTK
jgi:ketosteroid isomerase-like protein